MEIALHLNYELLLRTSHKNYGYCENKLRTIENYIETFILCAKLRH